MAKLIQKKLGGSTLIEVTIASVIIVIVFALASTLIASLWRSGPSERKMIANSCLLKIANHYEIEKNHLEDQTLPEGLKLEKVEEEYEGHADILMVTLKLSETNSGDVINQLLFLYPKDENSQN
jgi:hypothetical protein